MLAREVRRAAAESHGDGAGALWGQARRAADSVGANIAEGCGRPTAADRRKYIAIAVGSLRETQHHLRICCDAGLVREPEYLRLTGLASVTRRMLQSLSASIG
jgi:four helix bundle protein